MAAHAGADPVNWYNSPQYSPLVLLLASLWKGVGASSLLYLAGLLGIDPQLYEAARIDGASKWQEIRLITLPLLLPVVIIQLLIAIGFIFNADFGLFYQVTRDSVALYPTTDVMDTFVFRSLTKIGNQFNAYYTDPAAIGNWERTKEINDSAKPSPILGFTFDRTPVETELAQTSEVMARVFKPIYDGTGDVATNIKTAQDELRAAGADTVLAELQRQIEAWKAARVFSDAASCVARTYRYPACRSSVANAPDAWGHAHDRINEVLHARDYRKRTLYCPTCVGRA